jgi:hypothetical protein
MANKESQARSSGPQVVIYQPSTRKSSLFAFVNKVSILKTFVLSIASEPEKYKRYVSQI